MQEDKIKEVIKKLESENNLFAEFGDYRLEKVKQDDFSLFSFFKNDEKIVSSQVITEDGFILAELKTSVVTNIPVSRQNIVAHAVNSDVLDYIGPAEQLRYNDDAVYLHRRLLLRIPFSNKERRRYLWNMQDIITKSLYLTPMITDQIKNYMLIIGN